jgi:nucleoside-diphosphate-sugar epimerase
MPTCERLRAECEAVLRERPQLWDGYRGARLFVTGGTGFFGRSLLEVLLFANERLSLDLSAVLLTRDPASFTERVPHLAHDPAITLHQGDVRGFQPPPGRFDLVIHGAFDADRAANSRDPLRMISTIVDGTQRVLDLAEAAGCRKFLYVSSGAAYRSDLQERGGRAPEVVCGGDETESAHACAKRVAEFLSVLRSRGAGFDATIARAFAFVGPYLPLDRHFAIGNFVRDALAGRPIVVQGDGTAVRSYLYSSDLALWLLAILAEGVPGHVYNVGSEEAIAIAELARLVASRAGGPVDVEIKGRAVAGAPVDRYVACTDRAREELGLRVTVPLEEAIDRTLGWHREGADSG